MTHSSTEMMASSIDSLALSFSLHKFLPPFWSKIAYTASCLSASSIHPR